MLPDAPETTVANVAYKATDAPDAPDSTDSTDRPQGAIKALYGASRVIFAVEALGALTLIAMFVISAIRG
jgi:hypothetical protein